MLVCNLKEITYIGYHPDANLLMYSFPVKRNQKFIDDYIPKAIAFWKCVQEYTEPEKVQRDFEDYTNNKEYQNIENLYLSACNEIDKLEESKDYWKKQMIEMANGKNIQGSFTKLSHVTQKGRVEYNRIPILQKVDLNMYRGKPTTSVRITRGRDADTNPDSISVI